MAQAFNSMLKHKSLLLGAAGVTAMVGAAALAGNKKPTADETMSTEKYKPGDDYKDTTSFAIDIVKELSKSGVSITFADVKTLLSFVFEAASGKPVDDKEMMMEKVIAIVTKLPEKSRARRKLTGVLITGLWDSLEHPPLSFQGPKYQYRQADGSHNNVLMPNLGAAGSPYAKSIRTTHMMHATRPDPGVLFDSLMARSDETYKENAAGVSSMLFYHASIIIHDIFRSNRHDSNISDTSSYLDLAPLYGSSVADQAKIRTFRNGMLKPDTYFEERLLAQPPGINVMLVLYSRYHNFVADMILKINEGGRFNLKPGPEAEALKQQDEDLFQTARLIVNGLYINICLHDYLRALTNTHHSDSTWTLDPRIEIPGGALKSDTPRGIGNQVSTEFNLMYRFHSTVSKRDEKWFEDFFGEIGNFDKPLSEATPREMLLALKGYEDSIPEDPSQRTFAHLKRDANGRFNDADLVRVLKESMEDTAALFGPKNVPKALRVVEILGIQRARQWQTASLNEFRKYFGLKQHESFEDINADPQVADTLRGFYGHPDMVEAYPGMWLEDPKPAMTPGCGGCPPYTVGRAIFSDAVTLVRSDRFYTIDYTAATLTNWGIKEVEQDYETLGGSMLYKLIQRGLPGWFPFNSLHVMQPMFTKKTNEQIAKEIGTFGDYTLDDPKPPPMPKIVKTAKEAKAILRDSQNFASPWFKAFEQLADGHDYNHFMLSGEGSAQASQRQLMESLLFRLPEFKQLVRNTAYHYAYSYFKSEMFYWGKNNEGIPRNEIDLVRDVATPTLTRVLADLFCLDLKTEDNPMGTYSMASLYRDLLAVRTWGFGNADPGQAWKRRRQARDASARLRKATKAHLERLMSSHHGHGHQAGIIATLKSYLSGQGAPRGSRVEEGSLRWYGVQIATQLLAAGESMEKVVDIMFMTALAGVGVPISQFTESMYYMTNNGEFYTTVGNIKKLAMSDHEDAWEKLEKYVLEGERFSSAQRLLRVTKAKTTVEGVIYNPGELVIMLLGASGASMDPEHFPNPEEFDVTRPRKDYITTGYGMHECLGKDISLAYSTAMLKAAAGMQNMSWAPGNTGVLHPIMSHGVRLYLSEDGAHLTADPTTLKCHFTSYTHDLSKAGATPKNITTPIPTHVKKNMEDQLRPSDLAAEMLHIDETGCEYTPEEHKACFQANAFPGSVIEVEQNGTANGKTTFSSHKLHSKSMFAAVDHAVTHVSTHVEHAMGMSSRTDFMSSSS
ncbi:hypothetical protein CKM354_000797100 [Cercospora kikuchii]|uniref:Linoleate 8R-lipoxygenase n=1 Tax=Cercospora kikuchii TaxID=84275 RepID=A0A9P3CNS2_9PEZI|nr:uncharacterized protein CKM354_000797100 [Cercospora kikuchii]GIZ44782.1 hypothetical protein CKM354_000797100 [Cercospora kikuchii]